MGRPKHILVVAVFVVPLLVIVGVVAIKGKRAGHGQPPDPVEVAQITKHLSPLTRKWESADFTPIEDTPQFTERIATIEIVNSNDLNAGQERQLRETLHGYLLAYHLGTYAAFHRFRAPVSDFRLQDSVVNFLKDELRKSNQSIPTNHEGMFEIYWKRYVGNEWEHFWTGLSMEKAVVTIEATSRMPAALGEYVKERENAGVAMAGPMLRFGIAPEDVLKRRSRVQFATTSLLLKNKDVTCPVYCRFYWVEEYGKWVPLEQVAAYSGPRKTTLLF